MTQPDQPYPYEGLGVFSPKVHSFSILRRQLSQGTGGNLGLRILDREGNLTDATDVSIILYRDIDFDGSNAFEDEHPYGETVEAWLPDEVTREEKGVYSVPLTPAMTAERGNYAAVWTYTVGDEALTYTEHLQVIEYMPTYDVLRDSEKAVVQQVSFMLGDLFDSTNGGPNLAENFQTHFGFERIAQLMHLASTRINTTGIPVTSYGVGPGTTAFPREISGFLTIGTYLEVVRHFMRSYVEQPQFAGMNVTYTDRRDYLQRWQTILQSELPSFEKSLIHAKRKLLGLGRGSLLVSGGIYGRSGFFRPGTYAAQTRSMRFYPAAPAIVTRP